MRRPAPPRRPAAPRPPRRPPRPPPPPPRQRRRPLGLPPPRPPRRPPPALPPPLPRPRRPSSHRDQEQDAPDRGRCDRGGHRCLLVPRARSEAQGGGRPVRAGLQEAVPARDGEVPTRRLREVQGRV